MALKVEHEIHQRRLSRNLGVGALLAGFIAIVFGLTVVKVIQLGEAQQFEKTDHVIRPQIIPEQGDN